MSKIGEYEKRILEKRELINNMELAGCEDNQSQILYRKTKKQISNLKSEQKGYQKALKEVEEEIEKLTVIPLGMKAFIIENLKKELRE